MILLSMLPAVTIGRAFPGVAGMPKPRWGGLAALFRGVRSHMPPRGSARSVERVTDSPLPPRTGRDRDGRGRGLVSLVGAGPGASDLITLRGLRCLQQADVVFYDRLVDPALLDFTRAGAECVHVGKAPGATAWPQGRINDVIVAAARQGRRVVRLKCGDPGIFARGAEEGAACDAAGVAWEIVPGVTAASAAAAEIGTFLTERGRYDSLVLTTGQSRPGDPAPDWGRLVRPGTTLALYMAVAAASEIERGLIAGGAPATATVEIVSRAGTPEVTSFRTTLGRLGETVRLRDVKNPAILLVRLPKHADETAEVMAASPRVASAG